MYASLSREPVLSSSVPGNTKYTEYLKSLSGTRDRDIYNDDGGGGGQNFLKERRSHPLLPISDNEVKFSNIFSPRESNALKLQLLQKTSSLPLLDRDNNNNSSALLGEVSSGASRLISRRRSTASGIVHGNHPSNLVSRKGDSVANILYSTLRHGNDYDNPSADETLHTGSDSKVDYDPHEPLPPVDQIALRHELLNNIRAISRATYFEDLYTGKVRRNSGSPEAEILRLLENPQEAIATASNEANTIPSKDASLSRVDRWIKESSEASSRAQNNETDEEIKEETSSKQDQSSSLFHQSVWKDEKRESRRTKKEPVRTKTKANRKQGNVKEVTTDASSFTESDVETASAYMARTSQYKTTKFVNQKPSNSSVTSNDKSTTQQPFSRNTDRVNNAKSMGKYIPPTSGLIDSSSQYLQSKYLSPNVNNTTTDVHGKKRPFSFGYNGLDDGIPLSLSLPNVAQKPYISTPVALMHEHSSYKNHSFSRPENLNHTPSYSTSNASTFGKIKKRENINAEQVRRMAPQPQQPALPGPRRMEVPNRGGAKRATKVPGIYTRLNANQWVVKKVCFYVNGDEHYPKFEYRFRHGKDIRDLDQLLDLLTKRFPILPTGARYIFTMDGYPINSLEELENENSYVVSSTRKFKALKYGGESSEHDSYGVIPDLKRSKKNGKPTSRLHKPLTRQLSASDGNLHQRGFGGNSSSFFMQNSVSTLNSKSVSDVPKLVAHVIQEASSSSTSSSSPMARQPIRVINGSRPAMQSQVLLNTKTSQPFEDLVRDLAMSVRIPKQPIGTRLETLAGRPIRSYSQLRSELKAGQRAFYIYSDEKKVEEMSSVNNLSKPSNNKGSRNKNGKPIVKAMLGNVNSNSSSDLSVPSPEMRQRRNRRRSPAPSPRSVSRASHHARPQTFTIQNEWK